MFDFISEFHFLRPLWLLGFIPACFLVVVSFRYRSPSNKLKEYIDSHFLAVLSSGKENKKTLFEPLLLAVFFLLSLIALAGPTWEKIELPVTKSQAATILIWDLSPSMQVTDIKPSRLVRSRHKLKDLLKSKQDGLTALIVYSGDAHVVTPLTEDVRTISSLLDSLSPEIMPSKGANIEEAYENAISLLEKHASDQNTVVVLTDDISRNAEQALSQLSRSHRHQLVIWTVGTETGAPIPLGDGRFARNARDEIVVAGLNENYIRQLSRNVGASYVPFSNTDEDVKEIHDLINRESIESAVSDGSDTRRFDAWEEFGRFLLLPILVSFAFCFRRGWMLPIWLLGLSAYPLEGHSLDLGTFLQTPDQRAQQAMDTGDYDTAASLFEDENWQAAAEYKNGNFQSVEDLYKNGSDTQSLFNLGNTLVQQRKYEQALDAYNQVLNSDPDHGFAKKNKEITEKLIEHQKQNQQNQNGEDGQENGEPSDTQQNQDAQNNSESPEANDGDQNDQNSEQSQENANQSDGNQNQEPSEQDADSSNSSEGQQQESDSEASSSTQNEEQAADPEQQNALDRHYEKNDNDEKKEHEESQNVASEEEQPGEGEQQMITDFDSRDERPSEEAQALEQWLRKVPDDPGRLMRNKFAQQYRQKQRDQNNKAWRKPPNEETRW